MAFEPYATFPQYHSHEGFDRYPDYINGFNSSIDGTDHTGLRVALSSTMDRFLQEHEPPFFKPSFSGIDEQGMQPYPDHVVDRRLPSPVSSGSHESSYVSSGWSDRQESPHSPLMNADSYSPLHTFNDGVPYAFGGHPPLKPHVSRTLNVCNMQDIQKCADHISEVAFEVMELHPFGVYGAFAPQEGYQPLQEVDDCDSEVSYSAPPSEYQAPQPTQTHELESPVIRRRRAQSHSRPSPITGSRVSKRPHTGRRTSSFHSAPDGSDTNNSNGNASGNRAFPCPLAIYGCQSSFGSKNEWKRHVNTQHMRLGYWRCDQCTSANTDRKPNDFNRKDLFIQHVRRMHPIEAPRTSSNKRSGSKSPKGNAEEVALQEAAARCYKSLRSSPEDSGCLFCEQKFHGRNTWDERMEHIGRHMENTKKESEDPEDPRDWRVDELAQNWLATEQIIVQQGNKRWVLATP